MLIVCLSLAALPSPGQVKTVAATGWQLLGEGYQLTADSAVTSNGTVYFTDARHNRIYRVPLDGRIELWKENSGGAHGVAADPDGRLLAGQHDRQRIVALDRTGHESVLAEGVQTHHLTVSRQSHVFFAEAPLHRVSVLDAGGHRRSVTTELNWPHGLVLTPDHSHLIVNDSHTSSVWRFRIQPDGSLTDGVPAYRLQTEGNSEDVDAGGMAFDGEGRLYVATRLGVQIFDRTARLQSILQPPGSEPLSAILFAGAGIQWMYATDGSRLYRRPAK
jgi:sugar lactone lactonase YvrE